MKKKRDRNETFFSVLCIRRRSEFEQFRRSRSCCISGQNNTVSHCKTGRFSKASLITNCRRIFIYKPQSFYWKSDELIRCLPILGHQREQWSTEGCCFSFSPPSDFHVSLRLKPSSLVYPLLFCIIICVK